MTDKLYDNIIEIKDNSKLINMAEHPIISELVNQNLSDLNQNCFIIFPSNIKDSQDLSEDNYIFRYREKDIWSCNVVGFLSQGELEIHIQSRFFNTDAKEDYLVKYLVEKVFNYNVLNRTIQGIGNRDVFDLLAFLFPLYLNRAMKKGLYKEYVTKYYNNANLKGPVDVQRHITLNTPFTGKIAYRNREYSYDNKVTQLVRHTIDYLRERDKMMKVKDDVYSNNIEMIERVTNQTFKRNNRKDIIADNKTNLVRHNYFHEYAELQKLCIKILNNEKIDYGSNQQAINGIIIDVAWLWEEYLNLLFQDKLTHSENKEKKRGCFLYKQEATSSSRKIYPDFYHKNKKLVADAKYKKFEGTKHSVRRDDLYQLITYSYVLQANQALVLYPATYETRYQHLGTVNGYGVKIGKLALRIPQKVNDYKTFCEQIKENEEVFLRKIKDIIYSN